MNMWPKLPIHSRQKKGNGEKNPFTLITILGAPHPHLWSNDQERRKLENSPMVNNGDLSNSRFNSMSLVIYVKWGILTPQPEVILLPRGHLTTSGDIFSCHSWGRGVLLDLVGKRPGMLLNILQCTGQPPTTKNYPAQVSLVPEWRNGALDKSFNFFMFTLTFKLTTDIVRRKAQ